MKLASFMNEIFLFVYLFVLIYFGRFWKSVLERPFYYPAYLNLGPTEVYPRLGLLYQTSAPTNHSNTSLRDTGYQHRVTLATTSQQAHENEMAVVRRSPRT